MARYEKAARIGDIEEGTAIAVTIGERTIALFNIGGEYYAINDMCPHRGGSLSRGKVEGTTVTCPMHKWTFDVRTGRLPMGGGVRGYPVRVEEGEIFVEI